MENQDAVKPTGEVGKPKEVEMPGEETDKETAPVVAAIAEVPAEKPRKAKRRAFSLRRHRKGVMVAAVLLVLAGVLYHFKGLFIAAMVDGSPISRISVIEDLEKRSGEQALDALITKKLINTEAAKEKIAISQAELDDDVKKVEEQVAKQGGTLKMALEQQGMTETEFREQLLLQKELEKILGDKISITDDEVNQYVTTNKAAAPAGMSDEDFKAQIREQLKGQKFSTEAEKWVTGAKAKANIIYYADHAAVPDGAVSAGTVTPQGGQ